MPSPPTALQPNDLVDHYKVLRMLERGGSAEVYLARDTRLGRRVALKLLATGARPQVEARAIARLSHPNIITVYGDGEHDGRPYLALEHLEGLTLRQRLGAGLGLQQGLRLARELAAALEHAHAEGVVHGDLKPENMQIGVDGRLRVLDFGLAAPWGETPEQIRGTPAYMAPERWRGEAAAAAEDIWALGCCLSEVFCGAHPYADLGAEDALRAAVTSEEPAPRAPAGGDDLPAELEALLQRCLEKQAQRRPEAAVIREVVTRLLHPQAAAAVEDDRSPFVGLRHFEEQDAALFFGREGEVGAFVERLRGEAVLSITGPSGAGKTSFIRAGVLPRLREQGRWTALHIRPGPRPLLALAARLAALLESGEGDAASKTLNLEQTLAAAPSLLSLLLEQIAAERGCNVLLVVDPLEELCTRCGDDAERARFMEAVCGAALDGSGPARIVLAFRDDYLSRLSTSEAARRALTRLTLLQRPGPEALLTALTMPAAAAGLSYDDPELPALMVAEVESQRVCLPPLQFTARQLWERRDRETKTLRRADYEAIGGVAGALAGHADGVLTALSNAEQGLTRALLLRLVTVEGTRRVVPQAEALEGLPRRAAAVLDHLIQGRLVAIHRADPSPDLEASEAEEDHAEVELVHESLVTSWDRLGAWLQRGRETRAVLEEAEQAAGLWQRRGSPDEGLWSGDDLAAAERAARRQGAVVEVIERFLTAARQREETQRRRAWRLRLGAVLGALVLVSALVINALVGTERQRIRAEDQASRAVRLWAEARVTDAERALEAGQRLTARAHLRAALELRDDVRARALWWRLDRDQRIWRRTIGSPVTALVATADGSVAAANQAGRILLFDGDGKIQQKFAAPRAADLRAAPNAAVLDAIGSGTRRSARLRATLRRLGALPAGAAGHQAVDLSPDGRWLATGGRDGKIHLWRLPAPQRPSRTLVGHSVAIRALAYSPDGEQLASGGTNGVIRVWHRRTGRVRTVLPGPSSSAQQLDFSANGRLLIAAHAAGEIQVWDTGTGQAIERWRRPHGDGPAHAAFYPGAPIRIVAGGADGEVSLRSLQLTDERAGHRGRVHAVAVTGAGAAALVVSAGRDHAVRIWDAARPRQRRCLVGHTRSVLAVAASPGGALIASGDAAGMIRIWDAATGVERRVLDCRGQVRTLEFSPGATPRLAAGCADGSVRLWEVDDSAPPRVFKGHRAAVLDLAFDPAGRLLTSASADTTLRTWNLGDGRQVRLLTGHRGKVTGVTYSSDGKAVVSVGDQGRALVWRDPNWRPTLLADGIGSNPRVGVLPDGRVVISSPLGGARICTPGPASATCASLGPLGGAFARPTALATAGPLIVIGYEGGSLNVWSAEPGAHPSPRWRPPSFSSNPTALWAHSDGAHLCLWSKDGELSLWKGKQRLGRSSNVASLDLLLATPQGCLTLSARKAELLTLDGSRRLLSGRALAAAYGPAPSTFSLAEADALVTLNTQGKRTRSRPLGIGATALVARKRGGLAVGYADGTLELQDASGKVQARHTSGPSSPVTVLASTAGLVLSGHVNGAVAGWQPGGNAPLKIAALLGPVIQIAHKGGKAVITSAAGDQRTVDLSALQRPYCDLMREVWRTSEEVWEGRQAVRRPPPDAHRCRRRRAAR
jgi:WD40 repeat protein